MARRVLPVVLALAGVYEASAATRVIGSSATFTVSTMASSKNISTHHYGTHITQDSSKLPGNLDAHDTDVGRVLLIKSGGDAASNLTNNDGKVGVVLKFEGVHPTSSSVVMSFAVDKVDGSGSTELALPSTGATPTWAPADRAYTLVWNDLTAIAAGTGGVAKSGDEIVFAGAPSTANAVSVQCGAKAWYHVADTTDTADLTSAQSFTGVTGATLGNCSCRSKSTTIGSDDMGSGGYIPLSLTIDMEVHAGACGPDADHYFTIMFLCGSDVDESGSEDKADSDNFFVPTTTNPAAVTEDKSGDCASTFTINTDDSFGAIATTNNALGTTSPGDFWAGSTYTLSQTQTGYMDTATGLKTTYTLAGDTEGDCKCAGTAWVAMYVSESATPAVLSAATTSQYDTLAYVKVSEGPTSDEDFAGLAFSANWLLIAVASLKM